MISPAPPVGRATARAASGGLAGRALRAPLTLIATALVTAVGATTALAEGATPLLLARTGTRLALDLSWAAVLGVLVVLLAARPAEDRDRQRLLDVAAVAAGVAAVCAASTAFLLYLGQAPAPSSPAFGPGLVAFLSEIAVGRTWSVAAILAAVLSAALVAVRSFRGTAVLALLAVASLVPVALESAAPDGTLAGTRTTGAAALVLLVAGGTWIGVTAVRGADAPVLRTLGPVCAVLAVVAVLLGALPLLPLGLPLAGVLLLAVAATRVRGAALPAGGLLGVAAGLAVAARVLQSAPTTAADRTSPAEILTGAPLPPAPTAVLLLTSWRPDAVWLLLGVALLLGYAATARRRRVRWSPLRTVSWAAGVLLLVWCTCGGPAVYAPVLLSAHLGQHAALATAVPLLLAGGAPLRLLAARRPEGTGGSRVAGPRLLRRPWLVVVLAGAAFVALYATPLLRWSATDAVGAEWSVLQCLLTGAALVAVLLRAPRRPAVLGAAVLLLVVSAAAALLGTARGLLLADWYGAMGWGADALVDQHAGAVLAWGIATASALVLLAAALRRPAAAPAGDPLPASRRSEVPA